MTSLHRSPSILFLALVAMTALLRPAQAAWPPPADDAGFDYSSPANWPNDPNYADAWDFWSFVPKKIEGQVDERTKRLGTGAHYDRAFSRTTGDRRVKIVVLDSGIEWENADTVNKWFLNAGELPVSQCPVTGGGRRRAALLRVPRRPRAA